MNQTPVTQEDKRARAIKVLGARWVLHPAYDAKGCAHHAPSYKTSAVLAAVRASAIAEGRL